MVNNWACSIRIIVKKYYLKKLLTTLNNFKKINLSFNHIFGKKKYAYYGYIKPTKNLRKTKKNKKKKQKKQVKYQFQKIQIQMLPTKSTKSMGVKRPK